MVPEYQQDKQRLTFLLRMMVYMHVLRSDLEGVSMHWLFGPNPIFIKWL